MLCLWADTRREVETRIIIASFCVDDWNCHDAKMNVRDLVCISQVTTYQFSYRSLASSHVLCSQHNNRSHQKIATAAVPSPLHSNA
jgi:hypothetical protein